MPCPGGAKTVLGQPKDTEKWNKAKEQAAKEGHSEDYEYIMGIYKKMAHLGKAECKLVIYTKIR